MNYFAHAYLSFNEPEIVTGNLISDFVKGKKKFDFSPGIQKGITLHRDIDTFTDDHPVTHHAKSFFKPAYRLYAGAFVDITYDHFLARSLDEGFLQHFTSNTYAILEERFDILPEKFKRLFPYMKNEDWLYNYRLKPLIEKSYWGLVRRAKFMDSEAEAIRVFHRHYDELQNCFDEFFPQLLQYATKRFYDLSGN